MTALRRLVSLPALEYIGVAGSIIAECDVCRVGIWIAPSGQAMLKQGFIPTCAQCVIGLAETEKPEIVQPTPAQKAELAQHGIFL